MTKIDIHICRIKNTPFRLVRSNGSVIGVFDEGFFISDKRRVKNILKGVDDDRNLQ